MTSLVSSCSRSLTRHPLSCIAGWTMATGLRGPERCPHVPAPLSKRRGKYQSRNWQSDCSCPGPFLLLLGSQSGGPGALAGPRCHVVRCGRDGAVCVLVGDPAPHGSNILDEPWASQGFGTQGGRLSLVPYGTFVRVSPAVLPATDRSEEGFVPTSLYVGCVPPPGLISHALACCSLQGPGGLGFCV